MNIDKGAKIYYRGDMANHEGWFTVTASAGGNVVLVEVESDNGHGRKMTIPACMIAGKDTGNGLVRFCTEAAYNEYRAARIAEAQAQYAKWVK